MPIFNKIETIPTGAADRIMGMAKIANIPICPAVIFAPNLMVRANGLTNIPNISMGIKINRTGAGTPLGIIFFQYPRNPCFIVPAIIMAKKVIEANPAVVLKFPVTVELPPGIRSKNGIIPRKLQMSMKIK